MTEDFAWLPMQAAWNDDFAAVCQIADPIEQWTGLRRLATARLDFVQTAKLDRLTQRIYANGLPLSLQIDRSRLALLGSSTVKHLVPGLRVACLRRNLWIDVYETEYGQYLQELMDPRSALHEFQPHFVCFSLDAHHLAEVGRLNATTALEHLNRCWELARNAFSCTTLQQTVLPVFPDLLGGNEHRLEDSPQTFVAALNHALRAAADASGVHLLAIDRYAAREGLDRWYDPALWHRSKQEIHPGVSHLYGEYLARLVAAQRGRSSKCLVLDLDNTLWGGVIGDDGLEGIVLGQGSAEGEAFLAFQRYLLRLKDRGVLLAVCSKNDEDNALSPFERHPEMAIKPGDLACFLANWDDKATNLRRIADTLNIGLDSLVFVDDNPFERNLVRRELGAVAVPELPEDPAGYIQCFAAAGYFEALSLSDEDRRRASLYRANAERDRMRQTVTDLQGYLDGLGMELTWSAFDEIGLRRIVQLINKTNQFNLTTRRYSEADIRAMLRNSRVLTWQVRLKDRFGDNGVVALLIAELKPSSDLVIDTWLMSCRVLGRQVEDACLNLLVDGASAAGASRILGDYIPTAKNGMVSDLYRRLGFREAGHPNDPEQSRWELCVASFTHRVCAIKILEEVHA